MKNVFILILCFCALFVFSACAASEPAVSIYKDGTYSITTEKDWEGYYAKGTLIVQKGAITNFSIDIYDSKNGDVLFDENYENYMSNEHYKQQCRNDLAGLKTYTAKFVETQNKDDVDTISGATWTWKWFDTVASDLLNQALKENQHE